MAAETPLPLPFQEEQTPIERRSTRFSFSHCFPYKVLVGTLSLSSFPSSTIKHSFTNLPIVCLRIPDIHDPQPKLKNNTTDKMKFSLITLATFALASTQVLAAPGKLDYGTKLARSAEADALADADAAPDARQMYRGNNVPRSAEPEARQM